MSADNREILLEAGPHFSSSTEVGATVIKSVAGRPVYLRDVARLEDGPAECRAVTPASALVLPSMRCPRLARPPATSRKPGKNARWSLIAVAKRKGSNAVHVAEAVIATAEKMHGTLIPEDVLLTITRDYGETANHKVNELVKH